MSYPCMRCGGNGCDVCVTSGVCPGCGSQWSTRKSLMQAEECAEMGRLQHSCRQCGRLVRPEEMAALLTTQPEARA